MACSYLLPLWYRLPLLAGLKICMILAEKAWKVRLSLPRASHGATGGLQYVETCAHRADRPLNSVEADDEAIAHLLPCKHDLHNACLKPWVERANSCPICRATFNMVELNEVVGGPVLDSYAVQDKVQEPELDPTMVVEDELFAVEAWEPCIICGMTDDVHEVMYCDGCDKAVHVFCAGFDDVPDVWYCESCLVDLENDIGLPGVASAMRRRPRRRAPTQRRARRNNDVVWARVWQEVSQRLDLDLDFPFDDEIGDQRTDEQRREFARWQRRFEVANSQGAANRLRGIAQARLQTAEVASRPEPESQEELRAWNAFDKARESQDAPVAVRRRKRKRTASPASSHEPEAIEQQQQKRPRLRRPLVATEQPPGPDSSATVAQPAGSGPTFLSSLLREVESKPISAGSPEASDYYNGQLSPRDSSPEGSLPSSGYATPTGVPGTPPPPPRRSLSPPLSSTIVPLSSPVNANFSPFSPADFSTVNGFHHRGRRRSAADSHSDEHAPMDRASSSSPTRNLSYSAKEEVQRMVKLALGSRYRVKEISKDQYTEINRDVSRRLYEMVGDASALADQAEREKWQGVADNEVKTAVAALSAAPNPSGSD